MIREVSRYAATGHLRVLLGAFSARTFSTVQARRYGAGYRALVGEFER